jgi:DNA-damage-inducible protein J
MNTNVTILTALQLDTRNAEIARKIFAKMGLDLAAGVNLYLNQVAIERGIPFTPTTLSPLDRLTLKAHAEIESGQYAGFVSVEDLLADLHEGSRKGD